MRPKSHGTASNKASSYEIPHIKTIPQPHAGILTFEELEEKGSPLSAPRHDSIWLLDDDVSMLRALGRLMNSAGFDVEKFSDPIAFLARLEQATCRLAVLDVWMPQMSGLEVQERLRRDSPATRVIFVTGRDDPMARQTAIEAGAFAFLAKPFDDEVLMQLIREAVPT